MPCLIRHIPITAGRSRLDESTAPEQTAQLDRWVENLAEAAAFEREPGVYGVFATWNGRRVVCLSRHLDRLEESASCAGFSLQLDRDYLRSEIDRLIDEAGFAEARVRVSAAPGSDSLMISAEPYDGPPMGLRVTGVRCATVSHVSRANPRAKQTSWLHTRSTIGEEDPEAYEYLLLDPSGGILEGTRTNFYVIRAGDGPSDIVLQTAEDGVLPGIARSIVLRVAPSLVRVELSCPALGDLDDFTEAFLTSASRGIVPIVQIDGRKVGTGKPGPTTAALTDAYDKMAKDLEEPLEPVR